MESVLHNLLKLWERKRNIVLKPYILINSVLFTFHKVVLEAYL